MVDEVSECIEPLVECDDAIRRRRWNEVSRHARRFNRAVGKLQKSRNGHGPYDFSNFVADVRRKGHRLRNLDRAISSGRVTVRPTLEVEDKGDVITGREPRILVTALKIEVS